MKNPIISKFDELVIVAWGDDVLLSAIDKMEVNVEELVEPATETKVEPAKRINFIALLKHDQDITIRMRMSLTKKVLIWAFLVLVSLVTTLMNIDPVMAKTIHDFLLKGS